MAAMHVLATFWLLLAGLAKGSGFQLVGLWDRIQTMTDNASGTAEAAPLGRVPAAYVACDGKLYIFGGETDDSSGQAPNRFLNDLWRYTPDQGWAMLSPGNDGSGPPPRVLSSMVCASGQLIIFGGVKRTSPVDNVIIGDVWSFNLAQGAWRQLQQDSADQSGPGPTSSHTATLVDSQPELMIVFGGSDLQGAATDKMWVYSLSNNTWTELSPKGPLPAARNFHTAIAIPGTSALKMWGGVDDRSLWTYDLRANYSRSGDSRSVTARHCTTAPRQRRRQTGAGGRCRCGVRRSLMEGAMQPLRALAPTFTCLVAIAARAPQEQWLPSGCLIFGACL